MGRPSTYRSNAFSGKVFLQGKRAWASNARPYKRFSTVRILSLLYGAQRRFATWNSTDFFGKIPLAAPGAQPVTSAG